MGRKLIGRILTKLRSVHNIDSALDLKNYDRFDIPETEKKVIEVIKDKNSTEDVHFTNNPQNVLNFGHFSRHSIIRGPASLRNAASKAKTEAIVHYLIETPSTNSSLAVRNILFDRL